MFEDFPGDNRYKVVVNHEEQYSLWPADKKTPVKWKDVGREGTKKECLAYISETWTDMRPLAVHKQMAEQIRKMR